MLQKKLLVLDMVGLNKKEELVVAERQKFVTASENADESDVGAGEGSIPPPPTAEGQLSEETQSSSRKRKWEE